MRGSSQVCRKHVRFHFERARRMVRLLERRGGFSEGRWEGQYAPSPIETFLKVGNTHKLFYRRPRRRPQRCKGGYIIVSQAVGLQSASRLPPADGFLCS